MNDGYPGLSGPDEPTTDKHDPFEEGRVAMVFVGAREMLGIVRGLRNCSYLNVIRGGSQIPEDARVVSVHQDWQTNGYYMMICHPSFEPVKPGKEPPKLDWGMDTVFDAVKLHRDRETHYKTGVEYDFAVALREDNKLYHVRKELVATVVSPELRDLFTLEDRAGNHPAGTLVGYDKAGNLWAATEEDQFRWAATKHKEAIEKGNCPECGQAANLGHCFHCNWSAEAPKEEPPRAPANPSSFFYGASRKPVEVKVLPIETLPLPIHHQGVVFDLRTLRASGPPISNPCKEVVEKVNLEGDGTAIYGLTNYPNRKTCDDQGNCILVPPPSDLREDGAVLMNPETEPPVALLPPYQHRKPYQSVKYKCIGCGASFDYGSEHVCGSAETSKAE